jgi:hypothetical protein
MHINCRSDDGKQKSASQGWIKIHPYYIGRAYGSMDWLGLKLCSSIGTTDFVTTEFIPLGVGSSNRINSVGRFELIPFVISLKKLPLKVMKKIIISILYIGTFGSCFFFSACKKKKDEPAPATSTSTSTPTPTPTTPTPTTPTPTTPTPTTTTSTGSFTLDGTTYTNGNVVVQKTSSSFLINFYAGNYTYPMVAIYMSNVTKTGTFNNITGNYGFIAYSLNNPQTDTYTSILTGSFSYTLTTFTANKIEGTFNLVATKSDGSKTATGSFNCTY